MTKFSDFIRNLGTAGPPTLQGIYALGFALRGELPTLLAKYLRVDTAQTFTAPEQLQGRGNLGLGTIATQDASVVAITGGTISGLTAPLAVGDGGTGGATAAAARTGIELGNVDNTSDANKPVSTATQTALDLKAPLASPALTGIPTAPTAALSTDTTQIATTAFVLANAVGFLPKSTPGVLGEWVKINAGSGAALVLPSGGTWAYFFFVYNVSGGAIQSPISGSGVAAGGTTVQAGSGTLGYSGFAWRVA